MSVIVPMHNIERYIDRCLRSLTAQNFRDYEVIVVDDGSSDRSKRRAEKWAEGYDRITVLSQERKGLSEARNAGLQVAGGEYVFFVDGDDFIEKNCMKRMYREVASQKYPEVVFLVGEKLFPDGTLEPMDPGLNSNRIIGKNHRTVLRHLMGLQRYPGSACTKLYRKTLIDENGLRFEKNKFSEDLDWTKEVLFAARTFGMVNGSCYFYRQMRQGAITSAASYANFADIAETVDRWLSEASGREGVCRDFLNSIACYEYKVLLLCYRYVEREKRKDAMGWLKRHRHLLSYRNDKDIRMIRFASHFVGLPVVCRMLAWYWRWKRESVS